MARSQHRPWRNLFALPSLLALTAITATAAAKSAADYYITSLPGAPLPLLKQYAGHITVTPPHHGNLFFWFNRARHVADRPRTVIWLNGGPGCSSMDGALMEIGPYRVKEDGTLRYNEGSWDEWANVLFVDNPVGTGFSYVDSDSYVHELGEMASQMVKFLEEWFKIFPEFEGDDLYIAGESYAGQHIPYVAKAILDRNAENKAGAKPWNLSGLLIGNGWISGPDQYPSYLEFGYEAGLVQSGSDVERTLQKQQDQCLKDLDAGGKDRVDTQSCEGILQDMLRLTTKNNECVNMYDVRLRDSYPSCGMSWPPDLAQVTPYLRRDDVVRALHINPDKKTGWQECNGQVSSNFKARQSRPSIELLPGLLEKVPIVLFSGDKDLICNHLGTETLISKLRFNGGVGMETSPGVTAPRRDWTFDSEPAGIYQTARNLTYLKFYNSSHMVPFDYPKRARDMLDRFTGLKTTNIGGKPAESLIDGEPANPNPPAWDGDHHLPSDSVKMPGDDAVAEEKAKAAAYKAYQRSGEVALTFLLIVLAIVAVFWWRGRRKRQGYKSLFGSDPYDGPNGGLQLDGSGRERFREAPDVEAARQFDESELDDLSRSRRGGGPDDEHFGIGEDEDSEGEVNGVNGKARTGNGYAH